MTIFSVNFSFKNLLIDPFAVLIAVKTNNFQLFCFTYFYFSTNDQAGLKAMTQIVVYQCLTARLQEYIFSIHLRYDYVTE